MSIRKYFDENKEKLFPAITDWTDPQNDIRHSNDVKGMDWADWFWCHPSAYTLIQIGAPSGMLFTSLVLGFFSYFKGWTLSIFFGGLMGAIALFMLYGKIKTYQTYKDTTFYDMHLREYASDKIK